MELAWLEDFLALEQTRNFTRAAALRCTTQSAYSRRVMRLEEWLKCRLFVRHTRPVQMTPEGQEFLARARRLREDMMDSRRVLGTLASHYECATRIYTTNTLAMGFAPDWLRTRQSTSLTLIVSSVTGCIEALKAGRADSLLLPVVPSHDDDLAAFQVDVVGHDVLALMGVPDLRQTIKMRAGKLQGPVMRYTPGTVYGQWIEAMLGLRGIALVSSAPCESPSAEALVSLAVHGFGAAWIPKILSRAPLVEYRLADDLRVPYDIGWVRKIL
ncbi:MAG: LysR family transcriptional regulator [Alphaproteobacteria bacterium]|nr:MAG: LysR family transcriptional regulator [Alphaproteobacteria bacterium]